VYDQNAAAERHAAEQVAEAERLYGELVVVMRELGRARRRQFCLQSPIACLGERVMGLVPRRFRG
jgi:hypothetical protein